MRKWDPFPRIARYRCRLARPLETVLYLLAVFLLILWFAGLVTSYTMGGFIHALLFVAIVLTVVRVTQGRDPIEMRR